MDAQDIGGWPFASGFDGMPMREWLISACEFIDHESGSEHVVLSSKIQRLDRQDLPGPDFTFRWKCALAFAGIAIGAVGTAIVGAVVVPIGGVLAGAGPAVTGSVILANSAICTGREVRDSVAGP